MIRHVMNDEKHFSIRTLDIIGEVLICRFSGLLSSFASLLVECIIDFVLSFREEKNKRAEGENVYLKNTETIYVTREIGSMNQIFMGKIFVSDE